MVPAHYSPSGADSPGEKENVMHSTSVPWRHAGAAFGYPLVPLVLRSPVFAMRAVHGHCRDSGACGPRGRWIVRIG